jgi:hypothetical protein
MSSHWLWLLWLVFGGGCLVFGPPWAPGPTAEATEESNGRAARARLASPERGTRWWLLVLVVNT